MPTDHLVPAPRRPSPTAGRARAIIAASGAALALTLLLGTPVGSAGQPAHPASPVPAAVTAPTGPDDTYALPLPGAPVVAIFRAPVRRWSAGHRGVDLEASPGDPVRSPAPGLVTFQGVVVGRSVLVVTHPDGLRSSLEPVVGTRPLGAAVGRGDVVGTVEDRTGHCPSGCLHWGVRRGPTYVDPLSLLAGSGPVVLMPVPP